MKAESGESLKHFKDIKHSADVYEQGYLDTSPSSAFDLEDWDTHQELEDWGFTHKGKHMKKLGKPRYHEIGPDGEPVMPVQSTIHSA